MKDKSKVRAITLCALFAGIISVCAIIVIPIPPIPITLALFAICLTGALLGAKLGLISVCVYLLLGAVGIPIFAGFKGGIAVLAGPTGGYLAGYLFTVAITGFFTRRWGYHFLKVCIAMALGVLVCYIFGTIWFMVYSNMGLWQSLTVCVFPFLIGDFLKILLASFLAVRLSKPLAERGWLKKQ